MKFFAVLVLAALAVIAAAVDVPFKTCADNTIISLKGLRASVWPPVKEQNFKLTTFGVANKAIADGKYKIVSKFSGIEVDKKEGNFCEFGDVACPTPAGEISIANEGVLPSSAPAGNYVLKTSATNGAGETIFCYTVEFSI